MQYLGKAANKTRRIKKKTEIRQGHEISIHKVKNKDSLNRENMHSH